MNEANTGDLQNKNIYVENGKRPVKISELQGRSAAYLKYFLTMSNKIETIVKEFLSQ